MTGKFIVFEGIDGSGKSYIIKKMYEYLLENNFSEEELVLTFEPTDGIFGQKVRKLQKSDQNPLTNARACFELYVKDREEHLQKVILPALEQNKIIFCDRYKYSTIVYQQVQGLQLDDLLAAHKEMKIPDLIIVFDLDPKIGLKRLGEDNTRESTEKFEKLEFLTKVRGLFKEIKNVLSNENIVFIDASKSKKEVLEQVKIIVKKELGI